jgi:hypothetical protein
VRCKGAAELEVRCKGQLSLGCGCRAGAACRPGQEAWELGGRCKGRGLTGRSGVPRRANPVETYLGEPALQRLPVCNALDCADLS